MNTNGKHQENSSSSLRWTGRILAMEDIRGSLNGHRELILAPRTLVTPLAEEELRTRGVRISRQVVDAPQKPLVLENAWGFAQDYPNPMVKSAVRTLHAEGIVLREFPNENKDFPCRWARSVAECVQRGECFGGVIFCQDPGLVCCVANKVSGLRASAVSTINQAARATLTLGANLLVVEMPGRTFFELRQILRILCSSENSACPDGVACTLQELDGHAHR